MKSLVILLIGIVILALGVLFTLQGAGIVQWPAHSFMINQGEWTERGVVVILIGLGVILTARRMRQT